MAKRQIEYTLTADASGLVTGLRQIKPAVDSASKATDAASKKMTAGLDKIKLGAAGVAAAAAGVAAALKAIEVGMTGINTAAQKASAFGVTVQEYEGLRLAAESVGASFDDLRGVIGNFSKNDDLRPPIEQIKTLADEIAALGPGAAATQKAVEAFGETGINLLPVLLRGSEGFNEMEQAARDFGLVVSEEAEVAAAQMARSIQEIKSRADGLARTLAAELLPALNDYLDLLLRSSTVTKGLDLAMSAVSTAIKAVITGVDALGVGVSLVINNVEFMARSVAATMLLIGQLGEAALARDFKSIPAIIAEDTQRAQRELLRLKDLQQGVLNDAATRWDALWGGGGSEGGGDAFVGPTLDMMGGEKTVKKTKETAKKVEDVVAAHLRRLSEIRENELAALAEVDWVLEDAQDAREQMERFTNEMDEIWHDAAWDAYKARDEAWSKALDDELAAQEKASEKQIKNYKKQQKQMEDIAQSIGTGIADALFGPSEQSLDDLLKKWGESLVRFGINAAVNNAFGFASGGLVPGGGNGRGDGVSARLSGGEYVMSADAVDRHGKAFFDRLNSMVGGGGGGGGSEIVVVAPSSEAELERLLSSKRGQRLIMATVQRYGG